MNKPHKKLDVWQAAMQVAKMVYNITSAFPSEEKYGLAQQMRRAAVSIPSNISEGARGPQTWNLLVALVTLVVKN
ncbi:MAG: four helix bundle protein [Thermodesulfobacteriota bacterium]|nr:four helix bundle protein [Thermodesulfobacteriota bacterium]